MASSFTDWNKDVDNAPVGRDLVCLLSNGAVRIQKNTGEIPEQGPQTRWISVVNGNRSPYPTVAYAEILDRSPSM